MQNNQRWDQVQEALSTTAGMTNDRRRTRVLQCKVNCLYIYIKMDSNDTASYFNLFLFIWPWDKVETQNALGAMEWKFHRWIAD